MAGIYVTTSGQTWDQIAFEVYRDEHLCDRIMDANRDRLDIFVFPDGIRLRIPDMESVTESSVPSDYPAWRTLMDG